MYNIEPSTCLEAITPTPFPSKHVAFQEEYWGIKELHYSCAIISDIEELRKEFFANPDRVNEQDHSGWSPLMYLTGNNNLSPEDRLTFTNDLIGINTDLNLQTNEGLTTPMIATSRGEYDMTNLFLESGKVNLTLTNHRKVTLMMFCSH